MWSSTLDILSQKSPARTVMQSLNMLEARGMETHAIINELKQNFPHINPSPTDTIQHIMYRSGQRSVVEWLLQRIEQWVEKEGALRENVGLNGVKNLERKG